MQSKKSTMDYRKLYFIVCTLYAICGALVSVYHVGGGDYTLALLGPASWLFLLVPPVGEKLLRLKLGFPLRCWVIIFALPAFTLGTGLRWHEGLYFDKLTHFLSGILFTVVGLCLYGRVSDKNPADRSKDILLQATYALFFSMFVAAVWETGEYLGYLVIGHDSQHTLTTGVHDTMQDIISCLTGSLIVSADYLYRLKKGKSSLFTSMVQAFDEANRA